MTSEERPQPWIRCSKCGKPYRLEEPIFQAEVIGSTLVEKAPEPTWFRDCRHSSDFAEWVVEP